MADIDESMLDPIGLGGKDQTFKPPVWKEKQFLIIADGMGKTIAEKSVAQQIGFHTAESAGEKSFVLFQNGRGPALGALMLNKKVHRTFSCKE
ncbi:MAG: hypothetical protein ACOZF0_12360 [Thermodesulfobacteriota bacterium]